MRSHRTYRHASWLVAGMLVALMLPAWAQQQCTVTWTLDEDFAEGTIINLGPGDGDELVLNTYTTPLPFVYVACSGRGTVVRIDINTGDILGEY